MTNRFQVILAAAVTAALAFGGLALAGVGVTKDCTTNTRAQCNGTDGNDDFIGEDVSDGDQGARDVIEGGKGRDGGDGNRGNDEMFGGPGIDGEINDFEGDAGDDLVSGGPGNDNELEGGEGNDEVLGGPGDDDQVDGGDGDDVVRGGDGDDGTGGLSVRGGAGENIISGGRGNDNIEANNSAPGDKEEVLGDQGKDTINAVDGIKDVIDCGNGEDTVTYDAKDEIKRCENKTLETP